MRSLVLWLTLFAPLALASPQTDVDSGIVAAQQSQWEDAIRKLTSATESGEGLDADATAKAYFWLGESKLGAFRESGAAADSGRLAQLASAPLEALDAFERAEAADANGRWTTSIERSRAQLQPLLLQGALSRMEEARKPDANQDRSLADARVWANAAARCTPDSYMAWNLRGQIDLAQQRPDDAKAAFQKSADLFGASPPATPDPLAAFVHWHLASLARAAQQPGQALAHADAGLALLEVESSRARSGGAAQSDRDKWAKHAAEARGSLDSLRLQILLESPAHRADALEAFKAAVAADPAATNLRLAYAQLLMPTDVDAAITELEVVIEQAPTNTAARFNLAALYQNEAARLINEGNDEEDSVVYSRKQEEAKLMMMQARPHFEAAWELDPTNLAVAGALLQITLTLDDAEGAATWRAHMDALKQP